jgi:hypothetical protein
MSFDMAMPHQRRRSGRIMELTERKMPTQNLMELASGASNLRRNLVRDVEGGDIPHGKRSLEYDQVKWIPALGKFFSGDHPIYGVSRLS